MCQRNKADQEAAETVPTYAIRLKGHLGPEWSEWFSGQKVTRLENGDTLLTGPVQDQSGLHGLLKRVRDLGLPLISVNRIDGGETPPRAQGELD